MTAYHKQAKLTCEYFYSFHLLNLLNNLGVVKLLRNNHVIHLRTGKHVVCICPATGNMSINWK